MDIEQVLNYDNLLKAWRKVSAKKSVPGVDGVSTYCFSADFGKQLDKLIFEVRHDIYKPVPIRILKKEKEVGLASVRDKLLQNAIIQVMEEVVERFSIKNNYGYRKGKSVYQAVDYINGMIRKHHLTHFYKADIHSFFKEIDHAVLLDKVLNITNCQQLTNLITLYIKIETIMDDKKSVNQKGILLGNPLSPLLSNIYLLEMDRTLEKELILYVRYADDILIGLKKDFCESEVEILNNELKKIKLELNHNKSGKVDMKNGFRYLGHEFKQQHDQYFDKGSAQLFLQDIINDQYERILQYIDKMTDVQEIDVDSIVEEIKKKGSFKYTLLFLIVVVKNHIHVPTHYEQLFYEKLSTQQVYTLKEIIQAYQDIHTLMERIVQYFIEEEMYSLAQQLNQFTDQEVDVHHQKLPLADMQKYLRLFQGRKDIYARGYCDVNGNKYYYKINRLLTAAEIENMLEDRHSLAIYPVTQQETCRFVVIDIDVDKKVLMEHGDSSAVYAAMLEKARCFAMEVKNKFYQNHMLSYVEFSGLKGYHVWIFFNEYISLVKIKQKIEPILFRLEVPQGIHFELIPNMTYEEEEIIKLPLSHHEVSHHRAVFIHDEGQPVKDQFEYIDQMMENNIDTLDIPPSDNRGILEPTENNICEKNQPKSITDFSEYIINIYQSCSLMKHIVDKSLKENYINHFERNALLYVFGHAGEEGRAFLHFVISNCINYNFEVTEGFIGRIKEKPVSCQKLQMRFKALSDGLQCRCSFEDYPLFYASPVIYAYMVCPEKVTKPEHYDQGARIAEMCRIDEQVRINALVASLIELAKSKREIDKQIKICCGELEQIFEGKGITEYEVDAGKLIKKQDEWYLKVL